MGDHVDVAGVAPAVDHHGLDDPPALDGGADHLLDRVDPVGHVADLDRLRRHLPSPVFVPLHRLFVCRLLQQASCLSGSLGYILT